MTLGRICQQTFITETDMRGMAGSGMKGEVAYHSFTKRSAKMLQVLLWLSSDIINRSVLRYHSYGNFFSKQTRIYLANIDMLYVHYMLVITMVPSINFKIAGFDAESRFFSNSCQLVGALLKSAIERTQENASTPLDFEAEYFCTEVVCKFTEPALALLSQSRQTSLRHLAISTLLPPILRTITRLGVSLANSIRSAMPEISR